MFAKAAAVSAILASSAVAVPTATVPEVDFSIGSVSARQLSGHVDNGAVANWNADNINDGIGGGRDEYRMYWGSGSTSDGWPDRSQWVSFVDM